LWCGGSFGSRHTIDSAHSDPDSYRPGNGTYDADADGDAHCGTLPDRGVR